MNELPFWVGASTVPPGTPAGGIRRLFLGSDGGLSLGPMHPVGPNPMFLARLPKGRIAIVHEVSDGSVSVAQADGDALKPGTRAATGSADPCHLAVLPDRHLAAVANYTGGTLSIHPVQDDWVGAATMIVAYQGRGPRRERQATSHPHQVVVNGDHLLVPDLGADAIHVHSIDSLVAGNPAHRDVPLKAGAGPRHVALAGATALVANELDRTVVAIDLASGVTRAWAPATLSPGLADQPGTSAIKVTKDGLVVVANRGPNTIAVFRWDDGANDLEMLDEKSCRGVHPRDLELTPDGRFVIVANQWSDTVEAFALSPAGLLTWSDSASTPSPGCILIDATEG